MFLKSCRSPQRYRLYNPFMSKISLLTYILHSGLYKIKCMACFRLRLKSRVGQNILNWLIIPICFLFFTHLAFADRSELGLGLQLNVGETLNKQAFDSNLGSFISAEQPAWSHNSQLLQIGLGLSFSSSLWFKLGLTQARALMKPAEDSYICINDTQANSESLNKADCAQLMSEFSNEAFQSIIAYNYKPFDDLSPFFELSSGI